ncbi:hypothetical protein XENOCAPTIV_018987 [Xenoophorus captivus]|uniref:Secreted protein n=1 Tax=Xenoophorus captivus TaxID=1517983 RepID=A0ABV0S098_9TELE
MGLLCWSLFSSFESYSSLTSTTGALRLFTGTSRSQRPRAPTVDAKEHPTDGSALPQPANGYSTRSTEPELTTH